MLSAGNDVTIALKGQFDQLGAIPQLRLRILGQLSNDLTQSRCRKPGHKMEIFFAHGFQIECTAHAVIKDKDRLLNAKASLQTPQQSAQGRRIGPVTTQYLKVDGYTVAIGGH